MKKPVYTCSVFLVAGMLVIPGLALAQSKTIPPVSDASFAEFLQKFEEGLGHFINGDPSLWKDNASHSDDATIFGGFGGYEKGWEELGPRYDWAASQFKKSGAKPKIEYITIVVSGDLAYAVSIERSESLVAEMTTPAPLALRSTQVFRKENGEWKLLHRHADHALEKTPPAK